MIFASLTMLCLLCAPALAQSSPSADQYQGGGSGYCPPGSTCIQSLADGADDFSENAEQGTGAVNDAMGAVSASAVSGDASAAPASSAGSPASYEGGGPGGITKLPETGGASLAALGSGILLVASGLVARRIAR
jgi:hypothetical protein